MENPYGAVTDALKDTRLTLRDIATGILATKKQEADLSLAKSRAETETAMVNAGVTRDQLSNQLHMAGLAENVRSNMAREANDTTRVGIAQQEADTHKKTSESTVRLHNAEAGKIAQEIAAENEVVSAKDFATRMGAGHIVDMLGIDPGMKLPARKWAGLGQNIRGLMAASPAMQFTAQGFKLKSNLEDLTKKYNQPGIDAAIKTKIKKDMESNYDALQRLDTFIMGVKEPDATKIAESARKLWTESPELANQYKNYESFADDYATKLKATRSAFHADLDNIKTRIATMDIDPNYVGTMQNSVQVINSLADKKLAASIDLGLKNRMSRNDLKGAYDYVTGWARNLQAKSKGILTPKTNPGTTDGEYDGMM